MSNFKKYRNKETGEIVEARGFGMKFVFGSGPIVLITIKSDKNKSVETLTLSELNKKFEEVSNDKS